MKAAERWVALVNEGIPKYGTYDRAWSNTRRTYSDLWDVMVAAERGVVALANSGPLRIPSLGQEKGEGPSLADVASSKFADLVADYEQRRKVEYRHAWNAVAKLHPELIAQMESGSGTRAHRSPIQALTNEASPAPVGGPQNKALLGLPAACSMDAYEVAFKANGNKVSPRNSGKIFDALVDYIQRSRHLQTYEAALDVCKSEFQQLWDEVQAIAK